MGNHLSQSPSLRGSGRFTLLAPPDPVAFVQSQSPSLRGSGRFFRKAATFLHRRTWFQSPSLRGSGRFANREQFYWLLDYCFNPLHCGAVVASGVGYVRVETLCLVSIPFIAGQWSLRPKASGVFWHEGEVSIPFIAGQWSLPLVKALDDVGPRLVSIPFIAGQWSLRRARRTRRMAGGGRFQSPSLRGSGRFDAEALITRLRHVLFQSPSLRGSGRFVAIALAAASGGSGFNPLHCGAVVASRRRRPGRAVRRRSFNPLHCGAVVASLRLPAAPAVRCCFNPLHCGAVVASIAATSLLS